MHTLSMDLAARIEMLTEDVTRLGGESMRYASISATLASELALLRGRVDAHESQIAALADTVARVHALTREIRDQQGVFAEDTVKHVQRLHRVLIGQGEIMHSVADGVAVAVAASTAQTDALATLSRARKTFALAPTLIGLGLFLAGLIAGLFR